MASETSSAVLELNDADTEDTEPPSIVDDAKDGEPLIMEHGYDIAVKVDAPMKQLSTLETFVTYRVRCVCARWPTPPFVRRRYNHFKALYKRLCTAHPLLAPPPPPPLHSARQQLDRYSPSFVALRTEALNYFLDRIAKHPILTHSEDFRLFLTTPDEELDKVFKSENSALNLWGLSSALYSGNDSKPSNGPRVKDPEFTSAGDYLLSLQHKLTTLCTLTTKLYKDSAALGDEWLGMKRVCDVWSSQGGGRAVSAAAAGASRSHAARCPARTQPQPQRLRARAHLPLAAAHARAIAGKIRERDALHAAQVAGNSSGDLHNRLEQASEAIRSELSDWIPKTRSETRAILLEIAERQVSTYTQTLMGWEHALKLSSDADVNELFKTVSRTAVQNLSPSKCKPDTPNQTERDVDDLESSNDVNSDLENDLQNFDLESKERGSFFEAGSSCDGNIEDVGSVEIVSNGNTNVISLSDGNTVSKKSGISNGAGSSNDEIIGAVGSIETVSNGNTNVVSLSDGNPASSSRKSEISNETSSNIEEISRIDIVSNGNTNVVSSSGGNTASSSRKSGHSKEELSKSEVINDPLQSFSEIDLS